MSMIKIMPIDQQELQTSPMLQKIYCVLSSTNWCNEFITLNKVIQNSAKNKVAGAKKKVWEAKKGWRSLKKVGEAERKLACLFIFNHRKSSGKTLDLFYIYETLAFLVLLSQILILYFQLNCDFSNNMIK